MRIPSFLSEMKKVVWVGKETGSLSYVRVGQTVKAMLRTAWSYILSSLLAICYTLVPFKA